jgi:predicted CXXCH cytochrome family protein
MPPSLRHSARRLVPCILCVLCMLGMLCGCSDLTRHKVLTTIFDGVPSMPPADQYCAEYLQDYLVKERDEREGKGKVVVSAGASSIHQPYGEKRCDDCHDKTTESGFVVKTKTELCFVCHTNFIKGAYVHGPVAVGDCLACHDPHTSALPHLLKVAAADICAGCHREPRQAVSLHDMTVSHGLVCVNCHNPHFGDVPFFLK